MLLTAFVSITAYTVANAIPFFTDLVSLIGAVTTVPLTLLFPAIFYRAQQRLPVWGIGGGASGALTYFSILFALIATAGSIDSILMDWSIQKQPFACR